MAGQPSLFARQETNEEAVVGKIVSFVGWCAFFVAVLSLVTFLFPSSPIRIKVNACGIPFWPFGLLLGPALVRRGRWMSGRKQFV